MKKTNEDVVVAGISKSSLECIEAVSFEAEKAKAKHRRSDASAFAGGNTFTDAQPVENLGGIADNELQAINELIKQPVIARIQFTDENDKEDVIFITRGTPRHVPGFKIASYRAPLGRIASLAAGDDDFFQIGATERHLRIENSAGFTPTRDQGVWDAIDSKIDIHGLGLFTIRSLRATLEPGIDLDEEELASLWDDESDANIVKGVRRAILSHMGLRDQPILDRHQDEIFRMPINSRCFLSGPPGTGKTTTLIRRLGQKTDKSALTEADVETRLLRRVEEETGQPHELSWVLFSPTELLRQYVKEAFAKEGLAASDERIRTWEEFRREMARDHFGLLRTSTGSGSFVERGTQDYLAPEIIDDATWYDDFRNFLDLSNSEELIADSDWLAKNSAGDLSLIGQRLLDIFETPKRDFYTSTARRVGDLVPEIRVAIDERSKSIGQILTLFRNTLTHTDRSFPEQLQEQISQQLASRMQEIEDEDDPDTVLDDDDEGANEPQPGRPVSRQQALVRLEQAVKTLARTTYNRRRVSEKTQDGILLAWLGSERLPPDEDILELGRLLIEQGRLRKFERLEPLFLRSIATKYKRFRTERIKEQRWYLTAPLKSSDIHWQELDVLVLAYLQIANELLTNYRARSGAVQPVSGPLAATRSLQRAQILVDEATDFSRIQLASMYEIAHPDIKSFFLCGDINQRLTSWGIKSTEDFDWIAPSILRKSITVSYRQSGRLVDLAKDVARIGGAQADDIVLPDRLDAEGVAPVWKEGLADNSTIAHWLAQRIEEIDRMVQKATTIAVLVTEEDQVEPLALVLNACLEEISLSAVACKDGKVVGNERDVRVFAIRHIKGLEFEAVFFVGLDKTVNDHPDLFSKYLYVGATRAATYLGVTFGGSIPAPVEGLAIHFEEDWQV